MRRRKWAALLAILAFALLLLSGCGGPAAQEPQPPAAGKETHGSPEQEEEKQDPPPAPAPQPEEKDEPEEAPPAPAEEAGGDAGQESSDSSDKPADGSKPEDEEDEPEPAPSEPEPVPEPPPEPDETETEPEPEGEAVVASGTYRIAVTLEGGSGRAGVESPAELRCDETGKCWATIVWSSPNFDYMKVDGQRYDPINTEGNSTFEIPVSAFDQPLEVIADTVAMSEPHEVAYTLTFDYASMEDA